MSEITSISSAKSHERTSTLFQPIDLRKVENNLLVEQLKKTAKQKSIHFRYPKVTKSALPWSP